MKITYTFPLIIVFMFPNISIGEEKTYESSLGTCDKIEGLSSRIMSARQNGVSMKNMMSIESLGDHMSKMIVDAYEYPRFETDQHKDRMIKDFSDEKYLECVKIMRKAYGK